MQELCGIATVSLSFQSIKTIFSTLVVPVKGHTLVISMLNAMTRSSTWVAWVDNRPRIMWEKLQISRTVLKLFITLYWIQSIIQLENVYASCMLMNLYSGTAGCVAINILSEHCRHTCRWQKGGTCFRVVEINQQNHWYGTRRIPPFEVIALIVTPLTFAYIYLCMYMTEYRLSRVILLKHCLLTFWVNTLGAVW